MTLDACLVIGKTLYPTKVKIIIQNALQNKPAKYGLDFGSLGSNERSLFYALFWQTLSCHTRTHKTDKAASWFNIIRLSGSQFQVKVDKQYT